MHITLSGPAGASSQDRGGQSYSPAAMENAPAASAANPATTTAARDTFDAATPRMRLEVETIPSSAPRTAARNQPVRPTRCNSGWGNQVRVMGWVSFPASDASPTACGPRGSGSPDAIRLGACRPVQPFRFSLDTKHRPAHEDMD